MARALMVQGTGSHVGKSLLVAGLCRAARRRGLTVRPFKPQNMSNNAAVTADGGEIGRAQALQARACGVPATTAMNPVLLKPEGARGAQLIVRGRVRARAGDPAHERLKATLLDEVLSAFGELRAEAELVLVEGAGSASEVNLRQGDIANMGFATAAEVPVLLAADIERGGAIASLVGTAALLPPEERALVEGFLINKFHGDVALFDGGLRVIEQHSGWPSLGVVPWFGALERLPAEDGVDLRGRVALGGERGAIRVAVPRWGGVANTDDLDPLAAEPDVELLLIEQGQPLPGDADLVLLLGSKNTIADLRLLREQGWDVDIHAHLRRGGRVLGLCAGYQMLGRVVRDPGGVEGPSGDLAPGLGLLDIETTLTDDKRLARCRGVHLPSGQPLVGYEIHAGRSEGPDCARPLVELAEPGARRDGAISADGRVAGCYVHGLLTADGVRHAVLGELAPQARRAYDLEAQVESTLDAWADHLEAHLDLERLLALAR